ncbi:MAG: hypothetical protein ACREBE_25970 [bacterium]
MFADEALLEALLDACRQAPDDDGPRLVWADAVGGERGEFVVIQCDLARGELAPAQAAAWRQRERELLAAYGREWAGRDAFEGRFEFRRGFVEAIMLDASMFMDRGEAIFRRAPLLRSLTATGLTGELDTLRRLLDSPAFFRLHGLDLCGIEVATELTELGWMYEPNSDEAARALVESGALRRLGALGISQTRLSAAGVHHLATSGDLHHLERVWLHQRVGYGEGFAVLFRASQVESLGESLAEVIDMTYASGAFGRVLQRLPPVTELHLDRISDHALATLGDSSAAATIETLWLSGTLTGFRAFPRLHTLDFMGEGLLLELVVIAALRCCCGCSRRLAQWRARERLIQDMSNILQRCCRSSR